MTKARLSATVEADLLAAGQRAVSEGRAESLSAWVNTALRQQAETDELLRAADGYFAAWEAAHGTITEAEMEAAHQAAQARAVEVRPTGRPQPEAGRGAA